MLVPVVSFGQAAPLGYLMPLISDKISPHHLLANDLEAICEVTL